MSADRDVRQWRALAIGGAAACGLLVYRVLVSPEHPLLYRVLHPEFWPPGRARLLRKFPLSGPPEDREGAAPDGD